MPDVADGYFDRTGFKRGSGDSNSEIDCLGLGSWFCCGWTIRPVRGSLYSGIAGWQMLILSPCELSFAPNELLAVKLNGHFAGDRDTPPNTPGSLNAPIPPSRNSENINPEVRVPVQLKDEWRVQE